MGLSDRSHQCQATVDYSFGTKSVSNLPIKITAAGLPVCGFLGSRISTIDNPFATNRFTHVAKVRKYHGGGSVLAELSGILQELGEEISL